MEPERRELDPIERALWCRERKELFQMTGFTWLGRFLTGGLRSRRVPPEHWSREKGMTVGVVAELRCACGVLHVIGLGHYPQVCTCERAFFFDGTDVWALNSPADRVSA